MARLTLMRSSANKKGPPTSSSSSATSSSTSKRAPATSSPRKLRSGNLIPRPANGFFLYRSEQQGVLKKIERDQRIISRTIGHMWQGLSKEEKASWNELAAQKKKEHEASYPDYQFKPKPRNHPAMKRKVKRNGADELARCKKMADILLSSGQDEVDLQATVQTLCPVPPPAIIESANKESVGHGKVDADQIQPHPHPRSLSRSSLPSPSPEVSDDHNVDDVLGYPPDSMIETRYYTPTSTPEALYSPTSTQPDEYHYSTSPTTPLYEHPTFHSAFHNVPCQLPPPPRHTAAITYNHLAFPHLQSQPHIHSANPFINPHHHTYPLLSTGPPSEFYCLPRGASATPPGMDQDPLLFLGAGVGAGAGGVNMCQYQPQHSRDNQSDLSYYHAPQPMYPVTVPVLGSDASRSPIPSGVHHKGGVKTGVSGGVGDAGGSGADCYGGAFASGQWTVMDGYYHKDPWSVLSPSTTPTSTSFSYPSFTPPDPSLEY